MSDYPATPSYGMGYGAPDQNNPPYLPPTYPNQYLPQGDGRMSQAGMPSSYDASLGTYGYNGPAPSFSASALASGVPPLPIFQGWNQDPTPLPPYAPAHTQQHYAGYSNGAHQNPQYYAPTQTPYQQPQAQQPASRPYDEGELSEGEFDGNAGASNNGQGRSTYTANQYRGNDNRGYVDTTERSSYSGAQDQNSHPSYHSSNNYSSYPARDSPQMRLQQSDAYSPYDSSRRTDYSEQVAPIQNYDSNASSNTGGKMNGATHNHQVRVQAIESSKPTPRTNGHHPISDAAATKPTPAPAPVSAPSNQHLDTPIPSAKVAEARKKAENAILNLWVHEIRFQRYIDEGVGEDVVEDLFDHLKMSKALSKSTNGSGDKIENQAPLAGRALKEDASTLVSGSVNPKQPEAIAQSNPLSALSNGQRSTTNGSVPNPGSIVATAIATTAVAKPAPTEKEKTLQSKMEALRKSREERAQKAAAKNNTKSPTSPTSTQSFLHQPIPASAPITNNTSTPEKPSVAPIQTQAVSSNHTISSQSPVQISNSQPQPQGPFIPGLFLASTAASPVTSISAQSPVLAQTNQRKRPVAADFDTPASTPFKRPFGQSRNDRPLVIDVSEEEQDSDDEDVAMDLESQADQDSPIQPFRRMSDQRSIAMHNLPPLTDFPSRKPFTPPSNSSAPSTPPVTHSTIKTAIGHPAVLQRKESEIELLKKKIAEAEARKKARKPASGTRTPRAAEPSTTLEKDGPTPDANLASKVEASMKMQHLIDVAEDKVSSDQQKLAEVQAAELAKAAELQKNEADRKRLRRQKLASDLPLVDAEVQQSQSKLEQLKAEMARLESEVQKNLEAKRVMAEEMERLGQETENQLQAQKEKLQDLTNEETMSSDALSHSSSYKTAEENVLGPALNASDRAETSPSVTTQETERPAVASSVDDREQLHSPVHTRNDSQDKFDIEENVKVPSASEMRSDPAERDSTDQALEAALQEAVRAEADSHETSDVEMETSFAPDPNQLAPQSPSASVQEEIDSPMYSPVLERTVPDLPDGESDNYEPPEATPPVDAPSPVESPPFSPAPPDAISESAHVVDDASIQVFDDNVQNDVGKVLPERNGSISQPIQSKSEEDHRVPLFTPYESPLKRFRAFRFHPEYTQQVAGGLRSLTYSHKIDPKAEFCRYELAGGTCNDATCDLQHFRDVGLPDDAVLTALGSPDEFTAEQRERFCEGLRGVLTNLRSRKIKDFDVIASEIVAHRAQFFGDDSKVLNLEGTTI